MSQYKQLNEGEFPPNNNPQIITGYEILRQSVNQGLRQNQEARKSSLKAAALVSRQSQLYAQAKVRLVLISRKKGLL
ncbi:unnamed protein product (macronuclear) [Paramecium tetraurelia]|uniref:Uncharacterized protein n=1 Tax=Paramecium tetraurelia TaxID=5888 RepID=A0E6K1_PARTE|nr:uncharacterized protein GSPATT00003783001 [Paramecium tetraurelia]CAK90918.1 unnamed protein product [Paramecium tetraurelia]|eukprot:XP_001458315.1 hypothetical protein (macronuclear) [Paramecium tetraurelia strain d4-2]